MTTLRLKNIGAIRSAEMNIDGLTVIAGENNSGKSTVGKALMTLIKADNSGEYKAKQSGYSLDATRERMRIFNRLINLIFANKISRYVGGGGVSVGEISLKSDTWEIDIGIQDNKCTSFTNNATETTFSDCIYVQTPLIWDLSDFFISIDTLKQEKNFMGEFLDVKYPYLLWELHQKFINKRYQETPDTKSLLENIENIIGGKFTREHGRFCFQNKDDRTIQLSNLATGIKNIGIIQMLLKNNHLNQSCFLVFDEPENHLHQLWQEKFTEILGNLAKSGVCMMINTHSIDILFGLETQLSKYRGEVNAGFYKAQNGIVSQVDNIEILKDLLRYGSGEAKNC